MGVMVFEDLVMVAFLVIVAAGMSPGTAVSAVAVLLQVAKSLAFCRRDSFGCAVCAACAGSDFEHQKARTAAAGVLWAGADCDGGRQAFGRV